MRNIICLLLLLFASSLSYSQSAWTKPKGEIYTQLAFNDISNYSSIFNKNGDDLYPSRVITDQTIQWYTEYGVSNTVTLVASIPFKLLKTGDLVPENLNPISIAEGNFNTLGNISLAARFKFPTKKYALSAQLQVELPTGSFDEDTGLRSGFESYTILPTIAIGNGRENLFFQAFTGVFLRTNDYSNGFKFYVEGGKRFFDQLWVIAYVDVVDSFEDGNVETAIQNLGTFLNLNDKEFSGFGIKLIEELNDKFGITTAFGGAFSANLEAKKASFNVGLYYKLKKS